MSSEVQYRLRVTIGRDINHGLHVFRKGDTFEPFDIPAANESDLEYAENWWRSRGHHTAIESRIVTHIYTGWKEVDRNGR